MALDRKSKFPGRIEKSSDYPGGKAVGRTAPDSRDGTPYDADLVNDFYGFLDKLILEAGIHRSGVPDTVLASDYYDAFIALFGNSSSDYKFIATKNYSHPALAFGSDDKLYISITDSVGKDPTSSPSAWAAVEIYKINTVWDATDAYLHPVIVLADDGKLYISSRDSVGKDPTSQPGYWTSLNEYFGEKNLVFDPNTDYIKPNLVIKPDNNLYALTARSPSGIPINKLIGKGLYWDPGQMYVHGDIVLGADEKLYIAKDSGRLRNDPVNSPESWELLEEALQWRTINWNAQVKYAPQAVTWDATSKTLWKNASNRTSRAQQPRQTSDTWDAFETSSAAKIAHLQSENVERDTTVGAAPEINMFPARLNFYNTRGELVRNRRYETTYRWPFTYYMPFNKIRFDSIGIKNEEIPGFGTRLLLPPGNRYNIYIVYQITGIDTGGDAATLKENSRALNGHRGNNPQFGSKIRNIGRIILPQGLETLRKYDTKEEPGSDRFNAYAPAYYLPLTTTSAQLIIGDRRGANNYRQQAVAQGAFPLIYNLTTDDAASTILVDGKQWIPVVLDLPQVFAYSGAARRTEIMPDSIMWLNSMSKPFKPEGSRKLFQVPFIYADMIVRIV